MNLRKGVKGFISIPAMERFASKVERSSSCWLWRGVLDRKGYGQFRLDNRITTAHRASWTLHHGSIPSGLFVCHTCDTPRCVNPEHLFLGTPKANAEDREAKGRGHDRANEGNPRAKLTAAQVREIRAKYVPRRYSTLRLAKEYGVVNSTILAIVRGDKWKSV